MAPVYATLGSRRGIWLYASREAAGGLGAFRLRRAMVGRGAQCLMPGPRAHRQITDVIAGPVFSSLSSAGCHPRS